MKKLKFLLLFVLSFVITSCDPSESIIFRNKGKSDLKVKLIVNPEFKERAVLVDDLELDKVIKGDSIVFIVKSGNFKENEKFMFFGRGRWSKEQIYETVKSINQIELENADHKIIYKSQKAINKLFLNNKKGILFKSIEISIDEDSFQ